MAPGSRLQELTAKYMQNPRRFFVPLANEYHLSGDLDRAIALCREHLPAQPGHMSGHIVLGRAYYAKGDHQAAHDVFLTSVALDDENLIALRHLGDIARGRRDVAEASRWYARILDADPDNTEVEQLLRSLDAPDGAEVVPSPSPASALGMAEPAAFGVAESQPPDVEQGSEIAAEMFSELSGLADPTPPGLRAIVGSDASPAFDADLVRQPHPLPPAVSRPLETFDLSMLDEPIETGIGGDATGSGEPVAAVAALPPDSIAASYAIGLAVDGGVGFALDDLDEIVEPAAAPVLDSLPAVEEADLSSHMATPEGASGVVPDVPTDELLSQPVFGALASFASWRTAQERLTPAASPVQPESPRPTPRHAAVIDDSDLFSEEGQTDAAATAPEFVTETMAALYAQQGFTQQAVDVYRALLARNPDDTVLTMKVLELQAILDRVPVRDPLQDAADDALQFGVMDRTGSADSEVESMLESMYEVSPPSDVGEALGEGFDTAWSLDADAALTGGDDWFDDATIPESAGETGFGGDEIFGLAMAGFAPVSDAATGEPVAASASDRPVVALIDVFGSATVAAADDAAADFLFALAEQMVGRLPKEAPTLPVPDVLELPSAVASEETTGASSAPLLSFDRFFSGSGSPPRARVDTPVRAAVTPPRDLPDVTPSPSLSPTFGGVPVIPPAQPSAAPTWAGFDQFAAPLERPAAMPDAVPPSGSAVFWTPIGLPPAIPDAPVPRPATPASQSQESTPVSPPATMQPPDEATQTEPPRAPPSDFHRWLEGLS